MSGADVRRRKKIQFLEAVRGIAAAIVVVQHVLAAGIPAYQEITRNTLDLGRVGVVAFFLVSGYVIPLSLERQSIGVFLTRRFFRLYPVYWLALGVFCLIHIGTGVIPTQSALAIMANIFMVQGLIGLASMLPPAWTLSIELVFYGEAMGARLLRLIRMIALSGWFWLGLYLLLCIGARVIGKDLPVTFPLLLFVATVGHSVHQRDQGRSSFLLQYLAAAAVIIPIGSLLSVDPAWPPLTYSFSAFVGFALFFVMYRFRAKTFPRWTLWLGSISYAVYLFHPIVADVLHYLLGLPSWLVIALNFVLVPLVGWAVHRWIEQPAINMGVNLTKKRSAQAPAPASKVEQQQVSPSMD